MTLPLDWLAQNEVNHLQCLKSSNKLKKQSSGRLKATAKANEPNGSTNQRSVVFDAVPMF